VRNHSLVKTASPPTDSGFSLRAQRPPTWSVALTYPPIKPSRSSGANPSTPLSIAARNLLTASALPYQFHAATRLLLRLTFGGHRVIRLGTPESSRAFSRLKHHRWSRNFSPEHEIRPASAENYYNCRALPGKSLPMQIITFVSLISAGRSRSSVLGAPISHFLVGLPPSTWAAPSRFGGRRIY
jgi:hypothetical protein